MKPALFLLLGLAAFAQAPVFDAAVVQSSIADVADVDFTPGGRLELRGMTMLNLIEYAYGVEGGRVAGGSAWLNTERFDVLAQGLKGTSDARAKLMLRALLADRFHLKVHTEERPASAYVLTVGKKFLLKSATGPGAGACESKMDLVWVSFTCKNLTMAAFAKRVQQWAGGYLKHPVVDRTNLKGAYDLTLRWTARDALAQTPSGLSIFEAVEKELGLKLEEKMLPLPAIVVDNVDRTPTPNAPGASALFPPMPIEFEVADIKPSKPGAPNNGRIQLNGRIDFQAISLKSLIEFAYDTTGVVGAPKWLDSEYFDVVAKAPRAVPVDTLRVMTRALLADRFKLAVHSEDQPRAVYALVAGKRGPKLERAAGTERPGRELRAEEGLRTYTCKSTTMDQLAKQIRNQARAYLDHPVVNATGLEGAYDFSLSWTDRSRVLAKSDDPTGGLTVFEAIDRQLGLRLEMQKRPMPVLVIDHVNPVPSGN
jgi:uncharacterized protein (TIGR03435 family)